MIPVQTDKVLIIGSGFSARDVGLYEYKKDGWTIVTVNHAWMVTEDWTYHIFSGDYKGEKPIAPRDDQLSTSKYSESLIPYGGHQQCGYSIMLNASYWVMETLKPRVIGYLGADMVYVETSEGHTAFYGVGLDFQKNGISDPDRMANKYGPDDPDFLKNIYMRFSNIASKKGIRVINFSRVEGSRLPYEKSTPEIENEKLHD